MADESTDEDNETTFASIMAFATEMVEDERAEFEGEMPDHAGTLIVANASTLLQTLTNVAAVQAHEESDDLDDDEVREALEEDAVDILLGLGALKYEYDLDIEGAFDSRRSQVEAMKAAESMDELMEEMMAADDVDVDEMPQMGGPPEPGDDVTPDDYDPDDPDRHLQ